MLRLISRAIALTSRSERAVVHVFRCRGQGVLVVDRLVQLASRSRHLQSIVVPEDGIGLGKGQRAALNGVRVVCAARHVVFEIGLVIAHELQGIHGALLIMKRVPSLRRAPARVIKRQREEENPYSHSMVIVLPPRHSSCAWFSVPSRAECRQVTPCRVSSASGTKAGTTLKTFFKLRALSFCFCPKGASGRDSGARLGGIARF